MPSTPYIELGVNIDHVATVRQARGARAPDPVHAAFVAEQAGADGITVHLREDRRHIQDRDVELLRQTVRGRLNLEMAATDEMTAIASRLRPSHCCLVPERRVELTTEGGLDVVAQQSRLREVCERLAEAGISVSLFVDPDPRQIEAVARTGAAALELHTGAYAEARGTAREGERSRVVAAARQAAALGLRVNAGHGLDYENVRAIAAIGNIVELNIGFAIVARALFIGLGPAVAEMKRIMLEARS